MSEVCSVRDTAGRRRFFTFSVTDKELAATTKDQAQRVVVAALDKVASKLAEEIWVILQPHLHEAMKRAAANLEEKKSE